MSIYILIINYFIIIIIYFKYKRVVFGYILSDTFLNVMQNYCPIISVDYKQLCDLQLFVYYVYNVSIGNNFIY